MSARQKDQSSGGGSTLAGADIAEVSSFQMNLLLNLKIHSLVKERLSSYYVGFWPRFSRKVFPPNAGESVDVTNPRIGFVLLAAQMVKPTGPAKHYGGGLVRVRQNVNRSFDSFQASCLSNSVTGSASDLNFEGALGEAA